MQARFAPLGLALLLAAVFRWPPLLNANGINSDAAVPGLQAMHILQGEWAWKLWGAGYQAAIDPMVIAVFFALFGKSAHAMVAVPLVFLLLQIAMTYDIVRRRVSVAAGFIAVGVLVFSTMAINMPMTYIMRQVMVTTLIAGAWCADKAPGSPRPHRWLVASAAFMFAGFINDLFAMVMLPPLALFAGLCAWEGNADRKQRVRRVLAFVVPFVALMAVALVFHRKAPQQSLTIRALAPNWKLLWDHVLPFAFGYRVFLSNSPNAFTPWAAPVVVTVLQKIAAGLAGGLWVMGGVAFFWNKRVAWPARRLALLGTGCGSAALVAFLLSGQPSDMWSARYLAPLVWTAPFTLAPLIAGWGDKRVGLLLAPYLVSAAAAGWLAWGIYVDGPWPKLDARGRAADEQAVAAFLRERGVTHAAAQYWIAYRLTFLFEENPTVVPLEPGEDRYPPYRKAFDAAKKTALIFHPTEWRASPTPYEAMLKGTGVPYERHEISGFTVLLISK